MTIKHTKLPWWMASTDQIIEIRGQAEQGAHHVTICKIHGNDILNPSRRVDAELILRAVNSYDDTLEALEQARWLYDQLSLGSLEAAAKYGDNYEPPTDEQYLEIRRMIESAITIAKGKS